MTDDYLSSDDIHGRDTVTETVELPDGTSGRIEVEEATLGEMEQFESAEANGEAESDLVQQVFDDFVVRPGDLDAAEMSAPRVEAIMRAVYRAWGAAEGEIDELLADREGN